MLGLLLPSWRADILSPLLRAHGCSHFPTPVLMQSCRALIDATAPSSGPPDKHLYPLLAVLNLPTHRAAGKRAASRCQAAPAQPAGFGAVHCQSLFQLIFPLSGFLLSSLGHVFGRIHRSWKHPTKHLELRLGCIAQHLLQVAGYWCGCCLHI